MSVTFTKLFASITESTVWCEPDSTRICWITMLAMADSRGRVWGSIPGLSNRARISIEATRIAVATFLSPDPDSRTTTQEGRRIEVIDGGWRLINHEKYRSIRDEESIKESKRKYINDKRAKERLLQSVENVDRCRTDVDRCRANAEAYTEADKTKTKNKKYDAREHLFNLGVSKPVIEDWMTHRKNKSAAVTETAVKGILKEASKANMTLEAALSECCSRGWTGFKAEWIVQKKTTGESREDTIAGLCGTSRKIADIRDITGESYVINERMG